MGKEAGKTGNAAAARILNVGSTGTRTLAASGTTVMDARGFARLTILQDSSNMVTTLRRATGYAAAGSTAAAYINTIGSTASGEAQRFVLDVDWPFYEVANSSHGSCGWSLI